MAGGPDQDRDTRAEEVEDTGAEVTEVEEEEAAGGTGALTRGSGEGSSEGGERRGECERRESDRRRQRFQTEVSRTPCWLFQVQRRRRSRPARRAGLRRRVRGPGGGLRQPGGDAARVGRRRQREAVPGRGSAPGGR